MNYEKAESMADEFDRASDIEIAEREQATEITRRKLQPEIHSDFDGKNCVECAEELHSTRLVMGRVRCTDCQTIIETIKNKQYRR